jgi:hypothetical protein
MTNFFKYNNNNTKTSDLNQKKVLFDEDHFSMCVKDLCMVICTLKDEEGLDIVANLNPVEALDILTLLIENLVNCKFADWQNNGNL